MILSSVTFLSPLLAEGLAWKPPVPGGIEPASRMLP